MKRLIFSIIVASLTLGIILPIFAQAQATNESKRTASNRQQNLSAEERAKMRERFRSMSPDERERFRSEMRGRFGPGRGALVTQDPMGSLDRQIEQLTKEHEQNLKDLKEILAVANSEEAKKTASRIEALIAKSQKAFDEKVQKLRQRNAWLQLARGGRKPSGKKAPDFKLTSFDGKETSLAALKGKIVVLEWINFECPFSKYHYETKTTMVDMAKKYKGKGVTWLAINSTNHTKAAANTSFARKHKLPYPILDDIPGKVGKAYGAKTTPHIFVIDKTGSIAYDGAIDNAPLGKIAKNEKYVNYVSQTLDALLAGKPVTTKQTKSYGCSVKYAK
ncbi:MAG: redoxin domain-containing protein [Planctomycetota bacterium]